MFQAGCTSARVVFGRYLQGTHRSLRNLSHALSGETARIGCSSGFWGDTSVAAPQLVRAGRIDFLVADYLSEITMSLLTRANQRNPAAGYTPDFLQACLGPLLKEIKTKGIRVISNAGGVNPDACKEQLLKLCEKQGINLDVAVVKGDNLMNKCDEIRATNVTEIDSGCLLPKAVVSMNAYLGAFPIAKALDAGAEVVITGRCVDSALVLGPLVHKFGWEKSDLDLLASGSLAGHLIECGAQCTGGIFTDWHKVHDWDKIGFPIVECDSKGKFFVTKPPNTGGLVSVPTVAEQLLYEIGDPSKYILPDVTCDFSQVQLKEIKVDGDDAVFVDGAKGMQPTPHYKVCATYADGYRALAVTLMIGPQAEEKARRTGESILKRTRTMLKQLGMDDYTETKLQVIGSESTYGHNARKDISGSRELFLWLAVKHADQKALEVFSREIAAAGTGMAPGFTYLVGGRPSVSPVLRLFSFLYPKKSLPISVETSGGAFEMSDYPIPTSKSPLEQTDGTSEAPLHAPLSGQCKYRLGELAYLRSGDKGNTANIGVVARKPEFYQLLKEKLTPEVVKNYFHHLLDSDGSVERYELPGICGLNFVLKNSLGGGGVSSLRCDPQGKAYGQMLSDLMIEDAPEFELHF